MHPVRLVTDTGACSKDAGSVPLGGIRSQGADATEAGGTMVALTPTAAHCKPCPAAISPWTRCCTRACDCAPA